MKFQLISTSYQNQARGPAVKLYGRQENGEPIIHTITGFRPYMYVLPKNWQEVTELLDTFQEVTEYCENWKFLPNGYQQERTQVLQVYVNRPGDVPKIRDILRVHPAVVDCYEADIIYATARFMTDHDIFGMGWVEVDNNNHIKPLNNIKVDAPLRFLGLDIEVQPPEVGVPVAKNGDPVTIISLSFNVEFNNVKSIVLVGKPGQDTINVKYYQDESALLLAFVDYVNKFDPDVIAHYNGHTFDWPYLIDRADALHVSLTIGRDGSIVVLKEFGSQKEVNIVGRASIDLMTAIKLNYSLTSYSLENVSKTLLNRPKLDVKASEMRRIWLEGTEKELHDFVLYAARDADLLQDIISELKLVDRYIAISKECGLLLHETINGGQTRRIESMLLRGFFEEGRLFPLKNKKGEGNKQEDVAGGKVFESEIGFYKKGIVMDYKSLYPSVMRAFNICWSSIINDETTDVKTILAPNNVKYTDHSVYEGILPRILTRLYNKRIELKTLMKKATTASEKEFYDNQQYAVKILLNSCYGYTGAITSRMYDPRLANSVTSAGRMAIALTKETAENLVKCKVVGGDTDSIFIKLLDENATPEDGQAAAKIIHDAMLTKLPPPMEIDFECFVESMLLESKKHYAMYILEQSKGGWKPKMKYRGIEIRRRDWVPLVGETMEKVLELILKEDKITEAWEYTNTVIQKVKMLHDIRSNTELAEKLILSRKIGNIEGYKNIQPHVTVYKKMESRKEPLPGLGDRIQYLALPGASSSKYGISESVDTPEYVRNTDGRIDNEWYVTHQIIPPLKRIFDAIGISVLTGKKLQKESDLFGFTQVEKPKVNIVVERKPKKTGLFSFT